MKFHILTLFPEMILQGLNLSIIGKAVEKNIISINAVDIRDYSMEKHRKVDDYPYGGGAGMLMQAEPVYNAHKAVTDGRVVRTIYVTPQGMPFTQAKAEELAAEEELVLLCGHYEGIDERVLEEIVTDYISIGDYVLTGGELPAMVMVDAVARLIPGVLGNDISSEEESFHNDLLEYPQYSRPEVWHGKKVPEVLMSGNHSKVAAWRLEQAMQRTANRRPDLYAKHQARQLLVKRLAREKRNHIHMMESLTRGCAEILYPDYGMTESLKATTGTKSAAEACSAENAGRAACAEPAAEVYSAENAGRAACAEPATEACGVENADRTAGIGPLKGPGNITNSFNSEKAAGMDVLLYHVKDKIGMISARDMVSGEKLVHLLPANAECVVASQDFTDRILTGMQYQLCGRYFPMLYTRKVVLPVKYKEIRLLTGTDWSLLEGFEEEFYKSIYCDNPNSSQWNVREYLQDRLKAGVMYGLFIEGHLAGVAGMHKGGSLGLFYVNMQYRRQGIAAALTAYLVNRMLEKGWIPYGYVPSEDMVAEKLLEKSGFYKATREVRIYIQKQ